MDSIGKLVKLDIRIADETIDALSAVIPAHYVKKLRKSHSA